MADMVLGIFTDKDTADKALDRLKSLGYSAKDVSVFVKDTVVTNVTQNPAESAAEGAVGGAVTGGALAGVAGLLVGIGAITIPGIGPLLIGGPIAAALGLTGAAATAVSAATSGIVAGGIVGALIGIGIPEETARVYETKLKEGAILLAVPLQTDRNDTDVREVFETLGADQIRTISDPMYKK